MLRFIRKYIVLSIIFISIALLVVSCANMATPQGGAEDWDPPKIEKSTPGLNATNVKKGEVTIIFDENVTIKDPSEKVIITPPQKAFPTIHVINRKVMVKLKDSLVANTTYTIDFTDAIVDSNEGNPLENFSYSFSTGDVVDSLAISGKVLSAHNLEPVKGIYVGIHSNLTDTAFVKLPFERISRTNESGSFTIRGVAAGKYRLYALDDPNRDYKYIDPSKAVAFMETIIEPSSEKAIKNDTLFTIKKGNGEEEPIKLVDTIKTVEYTRFTPDNIVLRSFVSSFQRRFLRNFERKENKLFIYFGSQTPLPKIEPLNFDKNLDWSVLERYPKNDTLIYWIKDKEINALDTIALQVLFLKTDSLNQDILTTDTLKFVDRNRKREIKQEEKEERKEEKIEKEKKKKGEVDEPQITFLEIKNNLSSTWDPFKSIELEFSQPLADSLKSKIILRQKKDTIFSNIPFDLIKDSINPRKYTIANKWQYGTEYSITIDSAAVHSIYDLWNNKLDQKFTVKKEDQYGHLAIWVNGVDSIHSFIELLDNGDKPIRKAKVIDNVAVFKDVNPGKYYARITLDRNNNGVWDTGDFYIDREPEVVCYLPRALDIKATFYHEENSPAWQIDVTTLSAQKPLEITKQKPQDKTDRKKKKEEQEAKENESRNNNTRNNNQQNDIYNNTNNNINGQY